jgi:SAM-dependent methyltransferase
MTSNREAAGKLSNENLVRMSEPVAYVGRDLEAMSFAVNYHRWILQIFKPYLGTRLVEVGAGNGSFSELILEHAVESLSLIEPSKAMYEILRDRLNQQLTATARIETYNSIFEQVAGQIKTTQHPDSIIYVNVLEHIADDEAELQTVNETLGAGGRLFIFVPAMHWLFGSIDEQIGHFRRYSKAELEDKCRRAGFEIVAARYFDFIGIAPWWVKYCLLRSDAVESWLVKLYDKFVVPAAEIMESIIEPPAGKNIILIAEKL